MVSSYPGKASASSKNSGRTLEEAIRMTQAAQAVLMENKDVHVSVVDDVVEDHQAIEFEPRTIDPDLQLVEAGWQADDVESQSGEVESQSGEAEPQSDEAGPQAVEAETQEKELVSK